MLRLVFLLLTLFFTYDSCHAQGDPKPCKKLQEREYGRRRTMSTKYKYTNFVRIERTFKGGTATNRLLLRTHNPDLDEPDGALVLLEDGTRLSWPDQPTSSSVKIDYGTWEHSCAILLNDEELVLLNSSPIKEFEVGGYVGYPLAKNASLVQGQCGCINAVN